jgi:hypothetical protein
MKVIITTEVLCDTELATPLVWHEFLKAEELHGDGSRRLLNLDDPTDATAYQAAYEATA